ncbi:hypothetical protein ACKKBG_A00085 [Auxenochlorella protothecoides x Auxenochlorella symbiontica]|uniref:DNA polymerase delta subunit 3 n=1 Tax=Auxenochlorella protothecoides TaxID=3075 RepID=A0A1D2A9J9_AUXPR
MVSQEGLELLSETVGNKLQAVTYKWLAREAHIPYDTSKAILFDFMTKHASTVHATFLLSGWRRSGEGARHVVSVIPAERLERAKAELQPITALHVYAVAPASQKDIAVLANLDYSQSAALLASGGTYAQEAQSLSCIQGGPQRKAPQKPDSVAQRTVLQPASRGGAGSVATSAPLPTAKEPLPKVEPPVQAMPKPRGEKGTDSGEAPPVSVKPANPPPVKEESVQALKPPKSRPGRQVLDDDASSDEEEHFAKPAASQLAQEPEPEKPAKKKGARASKGAPKKASKTHPHPPEASSDGVGAAEVAAPEGGAAQAKPASQTVAPSQAKGTKRVMKTYYNDAGEEVTEMVKEEADCNPVSPELAQRPPPVGPPAGPVPSPQRAQVAPVPSAKKAKSAAGQRNIMSFFGSK